MTIELSEEARKIIATTKLYEKDKIKEDLQNSISLNKTTESMLMDETVIEDELAIMKVENDLLKQLNRELFDKNLLLKELVNLKSTENNIKLPTYADMAKSDNKMNIIPNIIVKAKNKNNHNVDKNVTNQLLEDSTVPIRKIVTNKSGDVMIKCKNKEDVKGTTVLLSEKLKNDCQVEVQELKLPKFKILDVKNDMNLADLEEDIRNRNSAIMNGSFSLTDEYKPKSTQRILIMEVSPDTYDTVVKNGYKIYVGFQCCRVIDYIHMNLSVTQDDFELLPNTKGGNVIGESLSITWRGITNYFLLY